MTLDELTPDERQALMAAEHAMRWFYGNPCDVSAQRALRRVEHARRIVSAERVRWFEKVARLSFSMPSAWLAADSVRVVTLEEQSA